MNSNFLVIFSVRLFYNVFISYRTFAQMQTIGEFPSELRSMTNDLILYDLTRLKFTTSNILFGVSEILDSGFH